MIRKTFLGKIFISHSAKDKPFVRALCRKLSLEGYNVWLDEKELVPGDALAARLSDAIKNAKVFLIVVTPNSVTSAWVRFELSKAANRMASGDCRIVPVLRGQVELPAEVADLIYADCRKSISVGMQAILAALKKENEKAEYKAQPWQQFDVLLGEVFDHRGYAHIFGEYKGEDYEYVTAKEVLENDDEATIIYDVVFDYLNKGEPLGLPWWKEYKEEQDRFQHLFRLVVTQRPIGFKVDRKHPKSDKICSKLEQFEITGRIYTTLAVVFVDVHKVSDKHERLKRIRQGRELLNIISKEMQRQNSSEKNA